MYGARGKAGQQQCETIMNQFDKVYLTETDQEWASQQMKTYRLSHGISINDCLIAAITYRLQVPIYTSNVKDMKVMLPDNFVINPY
jgi:predicted nucleic acid-binding protein